MSDTPQETDSETKSRTRYQRASLSVLFRRPEDQPYSFSRVTVPILLSTNGTTDFRAACDKAINYYLKPITEKPDPNNP